MLSYLNLFNISLLNSEQMQEILSEQKKNNFTTSYHTCMETLDSPPLKRKGWFKGWVSHLSPVDM